jgi:hypothetical protein
MQCSRLLALTEHKPTATNAHVSLATIDDLTSPAVSELLGDWFDGLEQWMEEPHTRDSQRCIHPQSQKSQPCQLMVAQVLVYTNRHGGIPVAVINDHGLDVNALYSTDTGYCRYRLDTARFPIVTTNSVINRLAEADPNLLSQPEVVQLRSVIEALWVLCPVDSDENRISKRASTIWIRPEAQECVAQSRNPAVLDWKTFTERVDAMSKENFRSYRTNIGSSPQWVEYLNAESYCLF